MRCHYKVSEFKDTVNLRSSNRGTANARSSLLTGLSHTGDTYTKVNSRTRFGFILHICSGGEERRGKDVFGVCRLNIKTVPEAKR